MILESVQTFKIITVVLYIHTSTRPFIQMMPFRPETEFPLAKPGNERDYQLL